MSQTKAQLIDPVDGTIVNADISASAAIAGTKISPDFGSQAISTTGGLSSGTLNITGTTARINLTDSNNNSDYQVANENGLFRIRDTTNSVDRLDVDSSGNVGIGITSPSSKLQVRDSTQGCIVRVTAANDSEAGIDFGDDDDTDIGRIRYMNSNNGMKFITNASERMRIDSSGNVGIGTSSPGSELHVSSLGASDEPTIKISSENSSIFLRTAGSSGSFPTGSGGDDGELTYVGGDFRLGIGTASKNLIFFNGSGYTERMRIDSSGRLGIGTTSPNTKLDVRDGSATGISSRSTSTQSTDSNKGLRVRNNSDTDTFSVSYKGQGYFAGSVGIGTTSPSQLMELASTAPNIRLTDTVDGHSELDGNAASLKFNADKGNAKADTTITFFVDNSEKMRIDASGNVGIGTSSPTRRLHVIANANDDAATFLNQDTTNGFGINVQGGGTATDKYILRLAAGDGSEKARVTNQGTLLLGTNSRDESGQKITAVHSDSMIHLTKTGTGNKSCIVFLHGRATGSTKGNALIFRNAAGSSVGTVRITNTGTEFNVTSDYRLKENVVPISDGITRLKALKPSRFNFIIDATKTFDGFLAHEVTPAVPEAVSGEKDAVITQALIDSGDAPDGEIGDQIHQEIDQSKLVPLLTAALQEAVAKIETLETKNETLETKVAALEAA